MTLPIAIAGLLLALTAAALGILNACVVAVRVEPKVTRSRTDCAQDSKAKWHCSSVTTEEGRDDG